MFVKVEIYEQEGYTYLEELKKRKKYGISDETMEDILRSEWYEILCE